ncbi:hypothetical protein [Borrelia hermsii]|nr:hypothetical protein [Borrelia hermsii]
MIRDFFVKNDLGMSLTRKFAVGVRIVDLNVYRENVKGKERR